ncbi:MAG TPA: acyltransferase [Dongiaceae bacterium]|jgi:acetyltransferase-like isoleucine patch superfamily enzyme
MDLLADIRALLAKLRREMQEKYRRHVSTGDLLSDRWETARNLGFGEGSSCYDNVLVLGDVTVGKHCWIGPNVILDGSGGLTIGDHVDVCAGSQIYTHTTVRRAVSGGKEPVTHAPTHLGSRIYIGPQTVIAMGVTIGDGVTIGTMSLVDRDVPAGAKVWGIPARQRG